jgi:cell division protease FtsH
VTDSATPPTPPHVPPGKKPFPTVLIVVPILGVATLGLFLLVWQFLAPADRKQPVSYSDFMIEVHAGKVEDIKIHDREITFRVRGENGHSVVKETVGPVPDQALFDSLKPTDPNVPPPKVFFEK